MAFTYDPGTDRGRVRLRLADTREETPFFTDAEVDALLADAGSWQGAVAEGARIALMQVGRFARSYSHSDPSGESRQEDEAAAASFLQALIDMYDRRDPTLPTVGVVFPGNRPMDSGYTEI